MMTAKPRLSPIQAALHQAADRSVTSRGPRREARKTPRSTASSARTRNAKSTQSHALTCIVTSARQVGSFGEDAVHELDADGAFADGRGDALDAAGTNIADREDPRDAGLKQKRRALQRPSGEILAAHVGPRLHEALSGERQGAPEPFRGRD